MGLDVALQESSIQSFLYVEYFNTKFRIQILNKCA